MNTPQDHPDIEKLPLEIDGIPVRETIRAVFRNPEHGTPDNISKKGCLELALMSNLIAVSPGGARDIHSLINAAFREMINAPDLLKWVKENHERKTHVVWNAWRIGFPVRKSGFFNREFTNFADFSHFDFGAPPYSRIRFRKFAFGDFANFQNSRLNSCNDFAGASWGDESSFERTQWGEGAKFHKARWGGRCNFRQAIWGSQSQLQGAQWGDRCQFHGARWESYSNLSNTYWGYNCDLQGSQWGNASHLDESKWKGGANFKGAQWGFGVSFRGAEWQGDVKFQATDWDELTSLYTDENAFSSAKFWGQSHGLDPTAFSEIDFSGATFLGTADYSNRRFDGKLNFGLLPEEFKCKNIAYGYINDCGESKEVCNQRRYSVFSLPPKFHGCEVHQDTCFEGAKFPEPTGSAEAVRAYRTLKLAFSKQQAIREEQRFFRLEMAEETLRETGVKRWFFKAYQVVSEYGFSVVRPMAYLVALPFGWLMVLYACLSLFSLVPTGAFDEGGFSTTWSSQLLRWSLSNAIPIPGVDIAGKLRPALFGDGYLSVIALALELIQKLLALIAWFLSGLALRNLFKIK